METKNRLGIWMDHSHAHLMEYAEPMVTKVLTSHYTEAEKVESPDMSEKTMHNTEQHDNSQYYKELGEIIRNYDSVLLFGPTDAKTELLNILGKNHLFSKIKFEVIPTDKMSENQEHDFVREYFSKEW
ncbi:hypothetical protein QGN23_06365 [Chryseobacterium gotjawalense]|uniref:Translational machinery protein n=1 Tax=Chryseobacterium gotjawalense TaxID=3042315 RepID=A0ABY8RFZ7_9FLAO|nr:hypothetical protein [Chryseobacterium sp. wdc7]WHF52900.1 hypothetical protein QGN23_06365 [Chryseobacterium sp. wdc7]